MLFEEQSKVHVARGAVTTKHIQEEEELRVRVTVEHFRSQQTKLMLSRKSENWH